MNSVQERVWDRNGPLDRGRTEGGARRYLVEVTRAKREPLTPELVVGVGLQLLDEVGLTDFSMRALAERLGTYPATLYWHVGDRSTVLAAILTRVLSEMNVPVPGKDWRKWLRHMATEYREAIHRHPNIAAFTAAELQRGAAVEPLMESTLQVLHSAGFRDARLVFACNVYVGTITGWVAIELCSAPDDAGEEWAEEFASSAQELSPEAFPLMTRLMSEQLIGMRWRSGRDQPLDESFAMLLDVLIDGLQAQVS